MNSIVIDIENPIWLDNPPHWNDIKDWELFLNTDYKQTNEQFINTFETIPLADIEKTECLCRIMDTQLHIMKDKFYLQAIIKNAFTEVETYDIHYHKIGLD